MSKLVNGIRQFHILQMENNIFGMKIRKHGLKKTNDTWSAKVLWIPLWHDVNGRVEGLNGGYWHNDKFVEQYQYNPWWKKPTIQKRWTFYTYLAENLERGKRESIRGTKWKECLILPVQTGIKPKDWLIMSRSVLGVNVVKQPTAFFLLQTSN